MPTLDNRYGINGILDTSNPVLDNLELIAASCGCWITFDVHTGLWSVIINQPGSSVRSFDNSNIVGKMQLSSTGLTELYNGVKITYPRGDINAATDFVEADVPPGDRHYNEPDNILEMELPLTNDPVQALDIASVELKQGRVDRVVTFTTDYTAIDLNAGDLIDITMPSFGWTAKVFRIITMREADADDGAIAIEITALEYDADVYNNDLVKRTRSINNQITSIGDIGTPATPTVTIVDQDSRPRVEITAVTPATGLVAGMEFWLSRDNGANSFVLSGVERPPAGGVYPAGTTVSLDIDNINAGNVFAKVRAVNSKTSSLYSGVASASFAPVQITQGISPTTQTYPPLPYSPYQLLQQTSNQASNGGTVSYIQDSFYNNLYGNTGDGSIAIPSVLSGNAPANTSYVGSNILTFSYGNVIGGYNYLFNYALTPTAVTMSAGAVTASVSGTMTNYTFDPITTVFPDGLRATGNAKVLVSVYVNWGGTYGQNDAFKEITFELFADNVSAGSETTTAYNVSVNSDQSLFFITDAEYNMTPVFTGNLTLTSSNATIAVCNVDLRQLRGLTDMSEFDPVPPSPY